MKKIDIFELRYSTDIKEVGFVDQINCASIEIDREQLSYFQTLPRTSIPNDLPDLNIFVLDKKAKITDFLSNRYIQISNGIFINSRAKEIIDSFKLRNYKEYSLKIKNKEYTKEYTYFFYYIIEDPEIIDFAKSECHITDIMGEETIKIIPVSSAKEFYERYKVVQENNQILMLKKILLKEQMDVFRVTNESPLYISKTLKETLIKEKINGIRIKPSKIDFYINEE